MSPYAWTSVPQTVFFLVFCTFTDGRDFRGGFALVRQTNPEFIYAHCDIRPTKEILDHRAEEIAGSIDLRQPMTAFTRGWLEVRVHIEGLPLDDGISSYGMHVHEFGDLTNGCESTGHHYNPYEKDHGAPSDNNRHAGDFGNFIKDREGRVAKYFIDRVASISGPLSIIGRSIVLKAREDDLGSGGNAASKTTGNSGGRVACCVVGHATGAAWRGPST